MSGLLMKQSEENKEGIWNQLPQFVLVRRRNLICLWNKQQFIQLRVVLKVDGGPGRLQEAMLADLRLFGCYLFPSVQNTTQVTQETDQNYGEFKSKLREIIHVLIQENVAE